MKLAYFSPLSPIRSGISAYSQDLLPYLADRAEIDLFIDDYTPTHPIIAERFPIYSRLAYGANRWAYDATIYHLGNHLYHEGIYHTFLQYPGIVVLHDFNLYGLVGGATLGRDDRVGFVREMGYAQGIESSQRAWRIVNGRETMEANDYPLNRRVLDLSLGVIVHSNYVRRLVTQRSPQSRSIKVNMGIPLSPLPSTEARAKARQALSISPDDLLIASFGLVTPEKRVASVLRAFAELLKDYPHARYALVGEMAPGCDPAETVRELGLENRVIVTGYLPFADYQAYMAAADVAVNLRYPTAGETSASVLRLLAAGLPTLVSDVGWFAELPDAVCRKVAPDKAEVETLCQHLTQLASNAEARRSLGRRARDYVARHHSLEQAAADYITFIQTLLDDLG